MDTVEICYREAGEVIFESAARRRAPLRFNEKFGARRAAWSSPSRSRSCSASTSPVGACPRCQGFGNTIDYDMDRVIPDRSLSLDEGAVDPWTKPQVPFLAAAISRSTRRARCASNVPFCDLDAPTSATYCTKASSAASSTTWRRKKYKVHVRVFLSRYRGYALCPECKGARLRKEALYVRVGGKNWPRSCA